METPGGGKHARKFYLWGVYRTGKLSIHRRSWRNLEAVELATPDWVDWFNNRRLLEPIGKIPPG
jgi:transposase InsO family protein